MISVIMAPKFMIYLHTHQPSLNPLRLSSYLDQTKSYQSNIDRLFPIIIFNENHPQSSAELSLFHYEINIPC